MNVIFFAVLLLLRGPTTAGSSPTAVQKLAVPSYAVRTSLMVDRVLTLLFFNCVWLLGAMWSRSLE